MNLKLELEAVKQSQGQVWCVRCSRPRLATWRINGTAHCGHHSKVAVFRLAVRENSRAGPSQAASDAHQSDRGIHRRVCTLAGVRGYASVEEAECVLQELL
jgi:hypothetical protein